MLPSRLYHLLELLLCIVALAPLGHGGQGKRKNRRKQPTEPPTTTTTSPDLADLNICDIVTPEIIYCYCDTPEYQAAEDGNCWIFNDSSNEEFKYIWQNFAGQSTMKRLTLHLRPDGTLKEIPTEAVIQLPVLKLFEVQYAKVDEIHSYAFGNSTSIEEISLTRNNIISLGSHAFSNMPLLEKLILGENQITDINRNVFTHLPKLTRLLIDNNNITSIQDRAFQTLHHLVQLDLFSNQIQAIVPETFKGLRSLETLNLQKNRIEVIGDMTFHDLEALQHIDLKGNSLKYIAPKSFYGLGKLQKLDLQDNKLLALGTEVFQYTQDLVYLDIRHNVLETLYADTFVPLLDNLRTENMAFYPEGNNLRCDTRLSWLFVLINQTESRHVRKNLREIHCYLEGGTLPQRLDDGSVTPAYETSTLGIGPRVNLFSLELSELPEPYIRGQFPITPDPDCDDEVDKDDSSTRQTLNSNIPGGGKRQKNGNKNRGKKIKKDDSKAQSDMAANPKNNPTAEPQNEMNMEVQRQSPEDPRPPPPAQESRTYKDGNSGTIMEPVIAILIPLLLLNSFFGRFIH